MRLFFLSIGLFALLFDAFGQISCTQSLDQARTLFTDGHLYDIEETLSPCMESGFTREQKIQAYHLLTLTNLYLNRQQEAENTYLELLRLDPEFDVEEDNDNIEIVYLDSKFKTTPIFSVTAHAGVNLTSPFVINDYDINEADFETYSNKAGFWLGPGIDLNISKSLKVGMELLYRRTTYEYTGQRFSTSILDVKQRQNWITVAPHIKYTMQFGKFHPYLYAGYMGEFLLEATGGFSLTSAAIQDAEGQSIGGMRENPNIDLTTLRNRINQSIFGGIGLKKRVGYNYIFFELRYIGGLKNHVDAESRFPLTENYLYDFEALYQFSYLDDDVRLNSYSISIGFEKPIYKPRKVKKVKGFFRRLFN